MPPQILKRGCSKDGFAAASFDGLVYAGEVENATYMFQWSVAADHTFRYLRTDIKLPSPPKITPIPRKVPDKSGSVRGTA